MENSELQKRVKELRIRKGFSQEELADKSGLSLRTIQRMENGDTYTRGDTLTEKISNSVTGFADKIIDWQTQEDDNVIKMLNLSQLGFVVFPLLGIIIPLAIWILQKDKIKNVSSVGKSILNFQISWTICLSGVIIMSIFISMSILVLWYIFNFIIIIMNTMNYYKKKCVRYVPAFSFLH